MVTESGDLVFLAVQRRGEDLGPRDGARRPATSCCYRVPGRRSRSTSTTPTCSWSIRRSWCAVRPCRWGRARVQAIAVLLGMVILLATGAVPPAVAGLVAAGAIVLLGRADRRAGVSRD